MSGRCSGHHVCPTIGDACGCEESVPIACILSPGDFQQRIEWIQKLAREWLLHARRNDLTLHLTYASVARSHVRDMVCNEQRCCAFLQFNVREDREGIQVTIVAPEEARAAASELFEYFAPGLAEHGYQLETRKETTS